MKKLIAILMVLLCAFSLSAEWGRIQYVDEFGDVDPTISDPYQIVYGTKYEYGVTDWDYQFRLITQIPQEWGWLGPQHGLVIDIFDSYGNIVIFSDGSAEIKVKFASGDIVEFSYLFSDYEEGIYLTFFQDAEIARLMNELYKGNDLKFVIYYGDIRYNFTIDATGYRLIADEFIDNFSPPTMPVVEDDGEYKSIDYYLSKTVDGMDFVLNLDFSVSSDPEESPSIDTLLSCKSSSDVFWNGDSDPYEFTGARLESASGNFLSLDEYISDYHNLFIWNDPGIIAEMIDFARSEETVNFIIDIAPAMEFRIEFESEELINCLTY